jgi:hypothetical protein
MSESALKIEDDIPLPPLVFVREVKRRGLTQTLMRMQPGQSVFVPGIAPERMGGRLQHVRSTGRQFAVRTVEGGCRVWRTA